MKIGFVIYSLGSGGAERVLSELANYLVGHHEVYIFTLSNSEPFYQLDKKVHHFPLDIAKKPKNLIDRLRLISHRIKAIREAIEVHGIDVVISFMTQTNILSIIAAKLARRRVIVSERIVHHFYSRWIRTLRNFIYRFADFVVVQTRADALHYRFLKNIQIIPNPVRYNGCERNEISNKEPIVLGVGRLTQQKQFDLLIDVFCSMKLQGWRLVIVGDGQERQRLLSQKERCFQAKVDLVGREEDVFQWYKRASIFVLSSQKEGFPNVLLEAMACGCAVVSFDCPYGPGEIIENGVNGILVENQNKAALKEAIERLIYDEALRRRLSARAVEVREKYSIDKIGAMWEELIQKSLS
ncbi:MAG: glycosyltransferase family 4 protein [Nitratiruptor sp.]|nr:glycosyltransferase family 4 protein [Nitratiruptor sp.]NPA84321.1 glycosyltransferase family 4 protein [Campylobacterota bacterium]